MPTIQNIAPELIRQILSYLPEDALHNACAAARCFLESSPHLVYNCDGQLILGKRTADGVRIMGAEERSRVRVIQQLQAKNFHCQSLTILTDLKRPPVGEWRQDPLAARQTRELWQYRIPALLKLAERHKATMTGFHSPSRYIPGLESTLGLFKRLTDLSIHSKQDLNLKQFQSLRRLTVFCRPPWVNVQVAALPLLEQLTLHFECAPFSRFPTLPDKLVHLHSLPALTSLDLFAGCKSRLTQNVPLTFVMGESTSLRRARICGPFVVQDPPTLLDVVSSLGPALEVLSLARLKVLGDGWPTFGGPQGSMVDLLKLRALELHDVDPCFIASIFLPNLRKLLIVHHGPMTQSRGIIKLLRNVGDDLQVLSITSIGLHGMEDEMFHPGFVAQLVRCVNLRRFLCHGRYVFGRRDWQTLCRRVFRDLQSVHVWQPPCEQTPQHVNKRCVTDSSENSVIDGLVSLDKGCAFVRVSEQEKWRDIGQNPSRSQRSVCYRRRFLTLADPEGELSIAAGDLPRMCRASGRENDVRNRARMYSGSRLLMDTAYDSDRDVTEISDDSEDASEEHSEDDTDVEMA